MKIDFNKYQGHATGYIIKRVSSKNHKLVTETLIHGYAATVPQKIKLQEDFYFDIASLTKFFTAIVVYRAIEKGLLHLEDKVKEIDDRFINLDGIRIIDLLAHRQDIWTDGYLGDVKSKEEFYQILFTAYIKESEKTYVDTHYIILSVVLEKIFKQDYADIVKQEISDVLKLKNTSFKCLDEIKTVSNNYETVKGEINGEVYPGIIHDPKARVAQKFGFCVGHAGLFTTAADLLKLLVSLIDDRYILLNKDSIDKMLSHDDADGDTLLRLRKFAKERDLVIKDYDDLSKTYAEICRLAPSEIELLDRNLKLYNNCGTRFRNKYVIKNEIPPHASDNSIIFSGFTGPIFFVDFDRKVVILIMSNNCHNSKLNRFERYGLSNQMIIELYEDLISLPQQ